jgi:hypothetical protein
LEVEGGKAAGFSGARLQAETMVKAANNAREKNRSFGLKWIEILSVRCIVAARYQLWP